MKKLEKLVTRNPLFFAFFIPALVDGAVTVIGQGRGYWANPSLANEASPAYFFLVSSPWLFLLGSILWFVFWYWLFKRLKEPLNLFLMFLFIAGHSWGSTSWMWKIARDNLWYVKTSQFSVMRMWLVVVIYFSLIATIASYGLRVYLQKRHR